MAPPCTAHPQPAHPAVFHLSLARSLVPSPRSDARPITLIPAACHRRPDPCCLPAAHAAAEQAKKEQRAAALQQQNRDLLQQREANRAMALEAAAREEAEVRRITDMALESEARIRAKILEHS